MSLYLDLTEFLSNPITTGIQRIAGEMCRYLPPSVVPVRLYSGSYVALPPALISVIGRYFSDSSQSGQAEISRLSNVRGASKIKMSSGDMVLVPEVFMDPQRIAFFAELSDADLQSFRFIVYDLIPMTHPEYFSPEGVQSLYAYYRIIRRAPHCGFISEDTREAYYSRLKRTSARGGVVLPLGCDSLGLRADRPVLNRPLRFSVLGTIEPRKNHHLILEAFEPLLEKIDGLMLEFIGKMGWVDSQLAKRVYSLASDKKSKFRFHSAPADGAIRSFIEQSRATVYVSAAEGYGLPAVESLWVGTPVIASTTIPSLNGIGTMGVHYVEPLNAFSLRRAVLAFVNDEYADQKVKETTSLSLHTWKSFTEEILRWCSVN